MSIYVTTTDLALVTGDYFALIGLRCERIPSHATRREGRTFEAATATISSWPHLCRHGCPEAEFIGWYGERALDGRLRNFC